MQGSKIRLSTAEIELFCNEELILTKNSIVKKTVALLGEVKEALEQEALVKQYQLSASGKISKGENYLGLPYVILDYPKVSKEQNLFFIRSMFWWGNFFSSTLQLSGSFKEQHIEKLKEAYEVLSDSNYFICINDDPWLHHFEEDNYKKISSVTREGFAVIVEEIPHIKIAARWPLEKWDSAANKLIESWKLLIGFLLK